MYNANYIEKREDHQLRADKSPDLIILATGDWAKWVPEGKIGIHTADGKRYLVNAITYFAKKDSNRLSEMSCVEELT